MLFFASISQESWEEVAELGFWMVLVGVALEIFDVVVKWSHRKRTVSILEKEPMWILWVETFSVGLVVLGLSVELWGSHKAASMARDKSDRLTNKLDSTTKKAGDAIERAEQLETANLVLRSNVVALELKLHPRTITIPQANKFIKLTKDFYKMPIGICLGSQIDNETYNFAEQLNDLLGLAGYDQIQFPRGVITKPKLFIKRRIYDTATNNFSLWVMDGDSRNTNQMANYLDISPQSHPELFDGSIKESYARIAMALKNIGVDVMWSKTTNEMFRGDIMIYVPPQIY